MVKTRSTKRYSIAEARDQLARVVHEAEEGTLIELTRRNEPVAAVISMQEYQNFRQDKEQFWDKLQRFLKKLSADEHIQTKDLKGLRDSSPGRTVEF